MLSNQVSYSLADRRPERDLIPYAAESDHVVIAYSPDRRPRNMVRRRGLFSAESLERARGLFGVLRAVADAHGATPAQVALAWVIRHPNVVAIVGASAVEQVEANAAAAHLKLAADEIDALTVAATAFRPLR